MLHHAQKCPQRAFTLLEVMGVLAVIAILVALLIPTIFGAIRSAAVTQTAASLNAVKTACAGHAAQFGVLATDGSASPPSPILLDGSDPRAAQFDKVLLWEALLETVFSPKIGDGMISPTNARVQVVSALAPSIAPTQDNAAYNLDGNGVNATTGMVVVEAVITGVSLEDAKALNDLLDGSSLGQDASGNDVRGRVKYGTGGTDGNLTGSGNGNSNGNGNGNGNGLGQGAGNGGQNNGNGNFGSDNGNGNGGNGGNGNGNGTRNGNQSGGGGTASSASPATMTVHIYLTHR
jgi:prepilin-type N-terminal cleavage/methylation domain-containing protein